MFQKKLNFIGFIYNIILSFLFLLITGLAIPEQLSQRIVRDQSGTIANYSAGVIVFLIEVFLIIISVILYELIAIKKPNKMSLMRLWFLPSLVPLGYFSNIFTIIMARSIDSERQFVLSFYVFGLFTSIYFAIYSYYIYSDNNKALIL